MGDEENQLFRILFTHSDFLKLPQEEQLFFVRLAHVFDDLRHVFYLCVTAERGTRSDSRDERKLALHQLLFAVRLVYSILYEGWNVINDTWNGQKLGKTWNSQLSDEAQQSLRLLGKYFGGPNLTQTIRRKFGFHYDANELRAPLTQPSKRINEIISGKRSANVFYSFAEEIRSLALLQTAVPDVKPTKLWDDTATESDVRAAAIKLYEAFRPIRDAFDTFANSVLVTIVKSLPHKTERFIVPRVTKFLEMSPVLFVEESPK
jgi:hypothetical protein